MDSVNTIEKVRRHLVSTADELLWKFDRPVIFLGEWCRRYDKRHIWDGLDAIVAEPYGLENDVRDKDHQVARAFEDELLHNLCDILNDYHHTSHEYRYWQILLGHWLRRYIEVIVNRYNTLHLCLERYNPLSMSVIKNESGLISLDSHGAIWAFSDARWNGQIYSKILEHVENVNLSINIVDSHVPKINTSEIKKSKGICNKLRSIIVDTLRYLFQKLAKNEDAVIVNSYLPRWQEVLLNFSLRQIPQHNVEKRVDFSSVPINYVARNRLKSKLSIGATVGLESAIKNLLLDLIPVCYLEGYNKLTECADKLQWPSHPKFIFTSNNFDTDELFKAWVAKKVESGIPYLVGQHGNNYGTLRYMNPSIEEITADSFITWGWTDGLTQHVKGFVFKTCGNSIQTYDPNGGLLLVELHASSMLTTWDSVSEYNTYFAEQILFVESLRSDIKNKITVRLRDTIEDMGWCERDRWREYEPGIKLDFGKRKINELISSNRLVVHSYDSTGILEAINKNIPFVSFWQNGLNHLRESAVPYYKMLIDAGVLHLSYQSAATHINDIWDDIDGWWSSPSIQSAILSFRNVYARSSSTPIRDLKKTLLSSRKGNS